MNLDAKTALITGAAGGIGRETAIALRRAGARAVVICDVDEAGLAETAAAVRALGGEVLARRVDVSQREEMRAFADEVHAAHGAVDVLVNNAAVARALRFLETSLDEWQRVLSVNLMGYVHGCHFFLPPMVARAAGGHVVNVCSTAGFVASAGLAAYSTSKFGIFGLSEALRGELAPLGIGVSTICPFIVDTRLDAQLRQEWRAKGAKVAETRDYGPDIVAEAIVRAVVRNRGVVPVVAEARAMFLVKRFLPWLSPPRASWLCWNLARLLKLLRIGPRPRPRPASAFAPAPAIAPAPAAASVPAGDPR